MKKKVIAIDGPAGSGKSTVARRLARKLKAPYLDTGAMYRALTYLALTKKVSLKNAKAMETLARRARIDLQSQATGPSRISINGLDVTRQIRMPELTKKVHHVAAIPGVRRQLVLLQRRLGKRHGGVVEGRDIGTGVFPDTPYKFYLDADISERVRRRYDELKAKGVKVTLRQVTQDQKRRDGRDLRRKVAPLRQAPDAFIIDTTQLTIPQVVGRIARLILASRGGAKVLKPRSRRRHRG